MTPFDLARASLDLLNKELRESYEIGWKENDIRSAFIYRHARNISDLADDVFALESYNRCSGSRIIIRPMLESLFSLVAAIKLVDFAHEKIAYELKEEIRRINNWIETDGSGEAKTDLQETVDLLSALELTIRTNIGNTQPRKWLVYDVAKAADLGWNYSREYFLYSKYIHATSSGIITQEHEILRGHTMQTAIYIVLAVAGFTPQGIQTKTPQSHIDESSRLLKCGLELMESGIFKD